MNNPVFNLFYSEIDFFDGKMDNGYYFFYLRGIIH